MALTQEQLDLLHEAVSAGKFGKFMEKVPSQNGSNIVSQYICRASQIYKSIRNMDENDVLAVLDSYKVEKKSSLVLTKQQKVQEISLIDEEINKYQNG